MGHMDMGITGNMLVHVYSQCISIHGHLPARFGFPGSASKATETCPESTVRGPGREQMWLESKVNPGKSQQVSIGCW